MVLWTRFAAIVFILHYAVFAKLENDLQGMSLSLIDELLPKGFLAHCAKVPGCRLSNYVSTFKDSFNIKPGPVDILSYDYKVKKNLNVDQTNFVEGSDDSFESEAQSDNDKSRVRIEELSKNENVISSYDDEFDLLKPEEVKRHNSPTAGCDCRITNELIDLGHLYYPRYLLNAVCQKNDEAFEYPPKCWRGAQCRPLEYKVRVLTHRAHNDHLQKDPTTSLLPEALRSLWKFKTVTIAAGCFCS